MGKHQLIAEPLLSSPRSEHVHGLGCACARQYLTYHRVHTHTRYSIHTNNPRPWSKVPVVVSVPHSPTRFLALGVLHVRGPFV
ncbi:hypothetical protein CGMCC3_g15568 [Colletotrichum fructicola]|nr:uncharacterized protein CGMCC3_g15568 [Colletotrichum fructicola]KAE9568268.1 hypothetical protein CGMCC3_g15568 [Colletotrichum fructicola]